MQRAAPAISRRTSNGPKSLADCGSFATLARKAGALEALDRALRQTLPSPLREQVRFADLRHDRLVFLASSPAWASRLRLMQTQILATARAIGTCASSVTVKVAPQPPATIEPDRSKPLSPAAASHLRAAAASLTDPELRVLFLELASLAETAGSPCPDTH
ncbi:DciA family protein [Rhodanobacter sp. C01]|uniref:DciA family protein n=1 Tax=Rhodanobacter sp. C01 TaxID=1945856 RepID=UPI0009844264|nr:DciA family protein [Rhodanobacter sp. C01]OOG47828.1 hypothetical protein B0E50_10290 [Rhodanobacter sp. C01]